MNILGASREEAKRWVWLADSLLRDLGALNHYSAHAHALLATLKDALQLDALPARGTADLSPQDIGRVLAEEQPALSDILRAQPPAADDAWRAAEARVFTCSFPGLEALCDAPDRGAFEEFLSNCTTR